MEVLDGVRRCDDDLGNVRHCITGGRYINLDCFMWKGLAHIIS